VLKAGVYMIFFNSVFLKFILVGCINTLVATIFIFVLYNFAGFGYWVSSAAGYFIGSILNLFLNKYFTFRVKNWSAHMIISFVLTIAVSYLLAYGIAKPAVSYILSNNSVRLRDNTALLVGMCLFTGLNYLGQSFFVFKVFRTGE
jgi:putative flippase GtrA